MLKKLETLDRRVNRRIALYLSGGLIMAATMLMVIDAGMRAFFASPIWGMHDIIKIILTWLVFTAFAYALINNTHVRMTLVIDRLPPPVRPKFDIFGSLIGALFFAAVTYLSTPYFWTSWLVKEVPMSPIPAPVWLAKAAVPIGSLFMFLSFVVRLLRALRPTVEAVEEAEEVKGF